MNKLGLKTIILVIVTVVITAILEIACGENENALDSGDANNNGGSLVDSSGAKDMGDGMFDSSNVGSKNVSTADLPSTNIKENEIANSSSNDSTEDDIPFTIITEPLSVAPESIIGYLIPRGSIVHHYKDGIMKVFGPDGTLILKTQDSETPELPAPGGRKILATYQYIGPNGGRSEIVDDWTIKKYDANGELVLTIIDEIHKTR
jgi:hypothetical protein